MKCPKICPYEKTAEKNLSCIDISHTQYDCKIRLFLNRLDGAFKKGYDPANPFGGDNESCLNLQWEKEWRRQKEDKMKMKKALKISREVAQENGAAEKWLRHKCRWEQQSRTAIIVGYGDPRLFV